MRGYSKLSKNESGNSVLLHSLGKHRRSVAQSMIAALVATWLAVVCQQCLAYARDVVSAPDASGHSTHCQTPTPGGTPPLAGQSSCSSGCDCSALVTAATVIPPKSLLPPSGPDPTVALPAPISHTAVTAPRVRFVLAKSPDFVTSPILERFCIHLE